MWLILRRKYVDILRLMLIGPIDIGRYFIKVQFNLFLSVKYSLVRVATVCTTKYINVLTGRRALHTVLNRCCAIH